MDGFDNSLQVWVFEVDGARTLTTTQNFPVEELSRSADEHVIRAVDVDGDPGLELVATRSLTYVFERGSTSPYQTTPVNFAFRRTMWPSTFSD